MSKILGIIVGVLTAALGVWCLFTPLETYGILSWLLAFSMIADGISKIALYSDYQKVGVSDTWALVGGILSVALGIVLAGSLGMRLAVDVLIAYIVSFWILFGGCVRIMRSFKMRNVHKKLDSKLGENWGLALVVGILMVVLGILCFANPTIVMFAIGWQIGFAMIVGGVALITATA
jgi:uncharacterized membrane protein HdeD (DUF308 family)